MPPGGGTPPEGGPDDTRRSPLTVYLLIAVNVLVYAYTAIQASSFQYNSEAPLFEAWSLLPPLVWDGQWWRLLTSGFLHFGLIHLAVNMWSLWVIGKDLERLLGRRRFVLVYFASLFGGAVVALLFSPANYQIAGASGAVFGLMGGLVAVLAWVRLPLRSAMIIIVLNLVFSLTVPGISLADHLGGLATGALLTAAIIPGLGLVRYQPHGR